MFDVEKGRRSGYLKREVGDFSKYFADYSETAPLCGPPPPYALSTSSTSLLPVILHNGIDTTTGFVRNVYCWRSLCCRIRTNDVEFHTCYIEAIARPMQLQRKPLHHPTCTSSRELNSRHQSKERRSVAGGELHRP